MTESNSSRQNDPADSQSDGSETAAHPDSVVSAVGPHNNNSAVSDAVTSTQHAVEELRRETKRRLRREEWQRRRRRHFRVSLSLFLLTFLSTTLVGANYWPLDILPGFFNEESRVEILQFLDESWPVPEPMGIYERFWQSCALGCRYSIPLMIILLCHEMGHYLQAVRYRVPASFPFFIPLPLPPLGTMGAVILQGKGVADRKQMFDIAVTGPIAGLIATMPILIYGVYESGYVPTAWTRGYEFGQPLMVQWLIEAIHGSKPPGTSFYWNGYATAGWVGIFITAMNLLPIGQLDGGHILYTLVGRMAHWVAWGLILTAVVIMIRTGLFSYVLLLILLTITGPRHPPTANDAMPLGLARHVIGWVTLAFLLVGFTFQPIVISDEREHPTTNVIQPLPVDDVDDLMSSPSD